MRYPQLLVFERDGRIAWLLKDICAEHRWTCREPRQTEACLRLLRSGGPTVLVVRTTSKPARDQATEDAEQEQKTIERSFTLLERAHWLRPDAAVIAVGERDDPAMTALAWNLGAAYVLAPPQSLGILPELVGHMMGSLTRSVSPESVSGEEQP